MSPARICARCSTCGVVVAETGRADAALQETCRDAGNPYGFWCVSGWCAEEVERIASARTTR